MSIGIQSRVRFIPQFIPQLKSQNSFLGGAIGLNAPADSKTASQFLGAPESPRDNSFRLDYLA